MTLDDLLHRFTHRDSTPGNIGQHLSVAGTLAQTADWFRRLLPDGRETALVMTKLEEAAHWAHAALNNAMQLGVEDLPSAPAAPADPAPAPADPGAPVVPVQAAAPAAEQVPAPVDPAADPAPAPEHPENLPTEGGA